MHPYVYSIRAVVEDVVLYMVCMNVIIMRVARTNKSVVNEALDLHFYDVVPMHNFTHPDGVKRCTYKNSGAGGR